MGNRDPRVDAYIAKSAPFAQPILRHLRELVHRGCPDVVETIKWGAPAFDHRGPLCSMAAFKAHATFGFWKGSLVFASAQEKEAMGQFGRLAALGDLPPGAAIVALVERAARLNEAGIRQPRPPKHPKPPVRAPADLRAALARNAAARRTFDAFPPSHRREYVEWVTEAKTAATRARRLATTIEWLAAGKPHNWKYLAAKRKPAPAGGGSPRARSTKKTPSR